MWKAVFKKFYLVHSSILCPIWTSIYKFIWIQVLNMIWIVFRKLGKTLILVRLLYKRICEEEHHVLPVTNCINFWLFFAIWIVFHEHSLFTWQHGEGNGLSLFFFTKIACSWTLRKWSALYSEIFTTCSWSQHIELLGFNWWNLFPYGN